MSIISLENVTKYYGSDLILDHVFLNVNLGEKIALIGKNGTGKTTIFNIILKKEEITIDTHENQKGAVVYDSNLKIGYLDQNAISDIEHTVYEELLTAFSYVLSLKDKIEALEKELKSDYSQKNIEKYNFLLEEFNKNSGYSYDAKIKEMVSKFKLPASYLDTKIKYLSGGERMKVAFCKILLSNFDLLLLDEPTNHLDISTIEWLENFLKTYKGTILFISHDRYFIETLATKIVELDNHKLTTYNATYEQYLVLKKQHYDNLLKEYEKQQKDIAKIKWFIEYYMPKPRFVSRAKDRVKKLEKIEKNLIELPKNEHAISFNFQGENLSYKKLIEFNEVTCGYDKELTKPISFSIYGQDRIAIIGDNGIGKSTFIKSIINEIPFINGSKREMREINYAYIKQNDYNLGDKFNALTYLEDKFPLKSIKELRNSLATFLFTGDDVFKSVNNMSNGEKMRLLICEMSLSSYDLLILDEPTNHLDMQTKESLLDALVSYKGAVIFVSHDRYFINELATHILYLSKDKSVFFEGNYDNFKQNVLDKEAIVLEKVASQQIEEKVEKTKTVTKKLSNNALKKLMDEQALIEEELANINTKLSEQEDSNLDYDKINGRIEELETRYMEILSILEDENENS